MAGTKFLVVLVVALLIQIGEAQNFHYIVEVQHGEEYNGSSTYMNAFPMLLCSLIIGFSLQYLPTLS